MKKKKFDFIEKVSFGQYATYPYSAHIKSKITVRPKQFIAIVDDFTESLEAIIKEPLNHTKIDLLSGFNSRVYKAGNPEEVLYKIIEGPPHKPNVIVICPEDNNLNKRNLSRYIKTLR